MLLTAHRALGLLLVMVFRSLWVPFVSAGFNLLSVAAAYGVVVAVFQEGVGASLVGVALEGARPEDVEVEPEREKVPA